MSTVDPGKKSRDEIKAAREAKKLAKQKGKSKGNVGEDNVGDNKSVMKEVSNSDEQTPAKVSSTILKNVIKSKLLKGKDEVDKASIKTDSVIAVESDELKEKIKAERATKKLAKQANKKGLVEPSVDSLTNEMSSMAVSETIAEIVNVAKEVQAVTAKVNSLLLKLKAQQHEELPTKSKAELKAERRAKQEAQRASKQAIQSAKTKTDAAKPTAPAEATKPKKEEKLAKTKTLEKQKTKSQLAHRVNWFQHLYNEQYDQSMKKIPVNSSLHPAIIKLGVQLRTRVVSGSNARCIALLDALKKMISDYTLPAKTEFARGLEAQLSPALEHLWGARPPSASQSNAVKFLRRLLTQLPHAVDEFDAKKTLQEEIDSYIRDQIDKAGEAISLAVRDKISSGDNILTYGCSSLIERILCEAWQAGVAFRAVVVGERVHASAAREMLRRLVRAGVPATYVDITALSFIMSTVNKVLLGASALLSNGSVLGALGTAQVALAARAHNVPALVCCETHKFTERVQTDAFVHNELGDPDELIDPSDKNSPLKDWRSNPNLTPLNLTYDVTPPSLVTAVVTELAILPCTSAPVVLRFKLSEYGI